MEEYGDCYRQKLITRSCVKSLAFIANLSSFVEWKSDMFVTFCYRIQNELSNHSNVEKKGGKQKKKNGCDEEDGVW